MEQFHTINRITWSTLFGHVARIALCLQIYGRPDTIKISYDCGCKVPICLFVSLAIRRTCLRIV